MNPTAIYSKTGKGVQEASGKTSLLSRADRAVLAAIDGKTTFQDLQAKFEKTPADKLEALIRQLDKDGFVREVSAGAPAAPARPATTRPGTPPPPPPKKAESGEELDFTQSIRIPPRAPAPPPKPAEPPKPQIDFAALAREDAEKKAKEQEALDYRKRQEAEARAKAEAEAKAKAAAEARARAEAEARAKAAAEAEAKVKAAREAAVRAAMEAKAKADAEAKARADAEAKLEAERKAREEAERRSKEEAERARKEAEEKARREQEELRRQLEQERRAREEAEKKAKEEAERRAREDEERRKREEAERKQREEQEARRRKEEEERRAKEDAERRKREDEEAARRKREEEARRRREEEEAARRKREEEETARRKRDEEEAARRKREEEDARRKREEEEARRKREEEAEAKAKQEALAATLPPKTPAPAAPPPAPEPAVPELGDSLLADLDSFSKREEEERKAKEESDRKAKEERERRAKEEAERRKREEEEARRRAEEERRMREEEERRLREEEAREAREAEERKLREVEERKRQAEAVMAASRAAATAATDDIEVRDEDLDLDEVRRDEKVLAQRARQREEARREHEPVAAAPAAPRRAAKWGKPVAIGVFVALIAAVGALHVMPVSTAEYEKAASQAMGQPVKIGGARLSVITGVELKFERVSIGDSVKIGLVRAFPGVGGLFGSVKSFGRLELEKAVIGQEALGGALFGAAAGEDFRVGRVALKQAKLDGPIALPELDGEVVFAADGSVQAARLTGPDKLAVSVARKGGEATFEVGAGSFAVPFVPGMSLADFGMKGSATRDGLTVTEFDGRLYEGVLSGSARVRWGAGWTVDGEVRAKNVNAAVFAPALMSEGRGEGKGQFRMSGATPAKLGETARLEGGFRIDKGVLGSFDLARAVQSGGGQSAGRTVFSELGAQVVYAGGATQLRNLSVNAGALSAGGSLEIDAGGALAGRIVAELKTPARTLSATLSVGGTYKDPVLRK